MYIIENDEVGFWFLHQRLEMVKFQVLTCIRGQSVLTLLNDGEEELEGPQAASFLTGRFACDIRKLMHSLPSPVFLFLYEGEKWHLPAP